MAFLWWHAGRALDEFNESGHVDRDAHDRADTLRTWTNVAWVGCGLTALSGAVLVLTSPRHPSRPARTSAAVSPTAVWARVVF